ncbi:hypothetical protein STEG23_005321, partial [Scotinomys teguina]
VCKENIAGTLGLYMDKVISSKNKINYIIRCTAQLGYNDINKVLTAQMKASYNLELKTISEVPLSDCEELCHPDFLLLKISQYCVIQTRYLSIVNRAGPKKVMFTRLSGLINENLDNKSKPSPSTD